MKDTAIQDKSKMEIIQMTWSKIHAGIMKSAPFQKLANGQITRVQYIGLLRQIYFQVKESPQSFMLMGVYLRGPRRLVFRKMLEHALDEVGHEQLALQDLKSLGVDISGINRDRPLPETMALISFFYYLIQHLNPVGYLGYVIVLEFLAARSGGHLSSCLRKSGIPGDALNFINEHASLDQSHSKIIEKYVSELILTEDDLESVVYSMQVSSNLYVNMIRAALDVDDGYQLETAVQTASVVK